MFAPFLCFPCPAEKSLLQGIEKPDKLILPSMDKGRHAFQRQKISAGHRHRPRWATAHRRPLPRQPRFLLAGKSSGVFRERKSCPGRLTKQAGCRPAMRKTKLGAVSAPKNRICLCPSRVRDESCRFFPEKGPGNARKPREIGPEESRREGLPFLPRHGILLKRM